MFLNICTWPRSQHLGTVADGTVLFSSKRDGDVLLNTSMVITAWMKTFRAASVKSGYICMEISDWSGDVQIKLGAYLCLAYSKCWSSSCLHHHSRRV